MKNFIGDSKLKDTIYNTHTELEYKLTVTSNTSLIPSIASYVVRLAIGSNCGSEFIDFSFRLESYLRLKSIVIGSGSFKRQASLIIKKNPSLKSIRVGSDCFLGAGSDLSALEITNCPNLAVISIGSNSFRNAVNVILQTLKSLIVFEFNTTNFVHAEYFSLFELDRFEVLVIPPDAMQAIVTIQLISLPQLRKIVLGSNCWLGSRKQNEITCQGMLIILFLSRLPEA